MGKAKKRGIEQILDDKEVQVPQLGSKPKQALLDFGQKASSHSSKAYGQPLKDDFDTDSIKIYSWNINGLNATINKNALQEFLAKSDPDIVCFNETKTDDQKIETKFQFDMPSGYGQYWNCSKVKKGYSGVGIMSKVKPIKVTNDLGIQKHDGEGRVITIEFDKFIVVSVYTPNAGEGLKRLKYRTEEWD